LRFLRKAQTRYYIHSPFVHFFCEEIMRDSRHYYAFDDITNLKKNLLHSTEKFHHLDRGAGSSLATGNREKLVSAMAHRASLPEKYGHLFFRMIEYFRPAHILELGTCLGIGTAYLASPMQKSHVMTLEADPFLCQKAKKNFQALHLSNIELVQGSFEELLPVVLDRIPSVDFAYIDGDHRREPVLDYYRQIKNCCHENSILLFDDIHWSEDMEKAWNTIREDKDITLSIDLFRLGIVFFRQGRVKENFSLFY